MLTGQMIAEKVKLTRNAKQVVNKIKHLESQFKKTWTFANSETDAGVKESEHEADRNDNASLVSIGEESQRIAFETVINRKFKQIIYAPVY